jgi:uncharacterized protein YozE (UPF0346 family)
MDTDVCQRWSVDIFSDKRVSKEDKDFNTILKTIEDQVEFDRSTFWSFFPSIFYSLPGWMVNMDGLEKRRDHLYSFMLVHLQKAVT